jgi:FixJ family two-component response regulator
MQIMKERASHRASVRIRARPGAAPDHRPSAAALSTGGIVTVSHTDRYIAVVDDSEALRGALDSLLRSAGFKARCFTSAEDFLASQTHHRASCLILDVRLPGMSGLALQSQLSITGVRIPIVFISSTEDADGAHKARAMLDGAVAFLSKPFDPRVLLASIEGAVGVSVRPAARGSAA